MENNRKGIDPLWEFYHVYQIDPLTRTEEDWLGSNITNEQKRLINKERRREGRKLRNSKKKYKNSPHY